MTLALWAGAPAQAFADHLVVSLSTHRVQINSSFVGTELVLFGSIERDEQTASRARGFDIVVKVSGPPVTPRVAVGWTLRITLMFCGVLAIPVEGLVASIRTVPV